MPRERIATWPRSQANRLNVRAAETLAAGRVITLSEINRWQAFTFDPGGASRNVDLPPAAQCAGAYLMISNTADAAEVLTIRHNGSATIVTPTQAEACMVWSDGVAWYGFVGAQS